MKRKYEGKVDVLVFVFYATTAPQIYAVPYAEIVRDLIEAKEGRLIFKCESGMTT